MAVVARTSKVLECPGCHKHLRWSGGESARVCCPSCRTRLIVLVRPSGACEVVLENDEAVAQLITDWFKPDWDDEEEEDDDSSEMPPADASAREAG